MTARSEITQTSKELGVATSNLHRWNAEFNHKPTPAQVQARNEAEENKRLREEVKRLKMENEILKNLSCWQPTPQRMKMGLHPLAARQSPWCQEPVKKSESVVLRNPGMLL